MKGAHTNIGEYRNRLKQYCLLIAPETNPSELDELVQHFTFQKFAKKEMLIEAGTMSDTLFFILKGLVRVYYEKEEKEITNILATEDTIIAGAYSIFMKRESFNNYEAFEEVHVLKINYGLLEEMYYKYHSLAHLGRILVEKYYCAFIKKTHDVLYLSSEERYQQFLKDRQDLLHRVPLKIIASYLGIKQETLSRLRAKY